jgi:glutathione synthase
MRAAFQMDPPARLNPRLDTTFMLIEAAQKRGITCYCYEPRALTWRKGELFAKLQPITVDVSKTPAFTLGEASLQSLHDMDMVWMRQDPPFNMEYITATHLLEHLLPDTPVFNNPKGVRNAPEKLSALCHGDFVPPTLISSDAEVIHAFAAEQKTIVAKPLHGYGGRGVFKFSAGDSNLDTLLEHWTENYSEPLMWQAFLPEVKDKDMRVHLIAGEVVAQFLRIPAEGSIRANMRVGGTPKKASLSTRQQVICDALSPWLKAEGLLLAGLDFIGDYLTEINVTCPTGLRAVQMLEGRNLADTLWDHALASCTAQ